MKRILFVHHTSTIGGASYCLLNIVKGLDRTLFEPVVALKSEGPLADDLRKINVGVVLFKEMATVPYNRSVFSRRTLSAYLSVARSTSGFERLVRDEKADIVYLNNMMLSPYLEPSKRAGAKTVVHVREHWPLDEHKWQLELLRKIVYNHCDRLIAINRYSASMFPKMNATIVYDWIDMDKRDKPMPLNDIFGENVSDKKVFLYLGGMARIKGAYDVIETFVKSVKGDEYRLLVLGFTKDINTSGFTGKVRRLMHFLGIPLFEYQVKMLAQKDDRIVCKPFVYEIKDIVKQVYCELSYFTIPHANLPMAEAIILGTPVIAAWSEEAEEYSHGGKLAKLYPMGDRVAFAKAIHDFNHDDSTLREVLDSEEREVIERLFSEQENMARVNKLMNEVAQ